MRLELTDHATEDLRSISRYTSRQWGSDQENRYLRDLYLKFNEITTDPARWRFRNDLFPQCQVANFGRHVILFICRNELLVIVRVLHSSMDFKNHIQSDF